MCHKSIYMYQRSNVILAHVEIFMFTMTYSSSSSYINLFFKADHEQFDLLRRNAKEYSLLNRHKDPKCLLAEIIGCYLLIKKLFMINLKICMNAVTQYLCTEWYST